MLAKIIGHDARDGIGRATCGTGGDDGNGACGKGLGMGAGGGKHGCPGDKNLAALHGFLLLWPGGPVPSPWQLRSWQARALVRRGQVTEISHAAPLQAVSFCASLR